MTCAPEAACRRREITVVRCLLACGCQYGSLGPEGEIRHTQSLKLRARRLFIPSDLTGHPIDAPMRRCVPGPSLAIIIFAAATPCTHTTATTLCCTCLWNRHPVTAHCHDSRPRTYRSGSGDAAARDLRPVLHKRQVQLHTGRQVPPPLPHCATLPSCRPKPLHGSTASMGVRALRSRPTLCPLPPPLATSPSGVSRTSCTNAP